MDQATWLQWRKEGIGSSDAPIIMDISPWRTQYELWHDKVYGTSVQLDNSAMARGRELEPVARRWFEKTMGVCMFPKNKTHKEHEWIRASLDGMDIEDRVLVEIKCPNADDHSVALNDMVPDKYWPQVQHQLLVTGLPGMYYCSFDGSDGAIVEVARDDAYIESLFAKESEFWDHVTSKTPPELTEKDYVPMDENAEWQSLAKRWLKVHRIMDKYNAQEKEIKDKLLELCAKKNSRGAGIEISHVQCQGQIDYKLLNKDYPDLPLNKYRKKGFVRCTVRDIGGR